jgi:hypothetical protein
MGCNHATTAAGIRAVQMDIGPAYQYQDLSRKCEHWEAP